MHAAVSMAPTADKPEGRALFVHNAEWIEHEPSTRKVTITYKGNVPPSQTLSPVDFLVIGDNREEVMGLVGARVILNRTQDRKPGEETGIITDEEN